jgi:sugar/nucleoside kinase (ribokinase family)
MRRLGVVGLVSLDRVDGGLPRLGGAPYYAAQALHLLGHPAVLATKLAPEDRPRLAALGLPVVAHAARSTIAFRIENDGDRRRIALEVPGEPFTVDDARGWLADALAGVDFVHAGALTREDFPPETLAALRRGRVVSLDGQALVRSAARGELVPESDYDPDLLRHVDVLKLAREESDALGLGLDERSLASLGVREVVVTLGHGGAVVYADGLAEHVPSRSVPVADATGAGDMFATAYLFYRGRRHGPPSAARLAADLTRALLLRRRGETRPVPR